MNGTTRKELFIKNPFIKDFFLVSSNKRQHNKTQNTKKDLETCHIFSFLLTSLSFDPSTV